MPRRIPLDLTSPSLLGAVHIMHSPPPAYTQLPTESTKGNEGTSLSAVQEDETLDSESSTSSDLDFDEFAYSDEEEAEDEEEEMEEDEYSSPIDNQLVNDQDWEVSTSAAYASFKHSHESLKASLSPRRMPLET